jgi:hypothetical protein
MWDGDGHICWAPHKKTCLGKWTGANHRLQSFVMVSSRAIIVRLSEVFLSYYECYSYPDM